MESFSAWFWSDSFWFPEGISFNDFNKPGIVYARPTDLFYVPLLSAVIYASRLLFERFIALPIAKAYALSDGRDRKAPKANAVLEKYFETKSRQPSQDDIVGLAKQLDWKPLAVQRWFRRKRNFSRVSVQQKFRETSWRFIFYTGIFAYGFWVLWQAPWFWDHRYCWIGFPHQSLDTPTYIYYMLEASFYTSLLFTVMTDVKRKDFKEQVIHHVATLILIVFSYMANFVRVGTLVMAVHDISDVFLEGAKCVSYLKYSKAADVLFVIFAITFFITRMGILPFWVIHTTAVKGITILGHFHSCYFLNAFMVVLQCLHVYWGSIILKMACTMLFPGKVLQDGRSDVEEMSSDEDPKEREKNSNNNCINHNNRHPVTRGSKRD